MPSKSDYQDAIKNWARRAQQVSGRIPDQAWKPIAQDDLQRVLQGHSPLSDAEAIDRILATSGHAQIKDPQQGSSPLDIIGNIPSDIQGLVTGFIPGAVQYATTLPEQIKDLGKLIQRDPATQQKYGMETEGGIGAFIRDMARTPVFGPLVPGLHTAAATTSEQGRTELAQHPVSAAVDVMFAGKEIGKAFAGSELADVGTAREAFQEGKPVRGLIRAAGDRVPGFNRTDFNAWMMDTGLHPQLTETLAKPLQEIKTNAFREMKAFVDSQIKPIYGELSDADRANLSQVAQRGDQAEIAALPPEHQAIIEAIRQFNDQTFSLKEGQGLVKIPGPGGRLDVYSMDEPVAKLFRKATRAQELAVKAAGKLQDIIDHRESREAKLEPKLGKTRKFMESDETFNNRANHPVNMQTIREAAQPFVDSFRHLDPLAVYGHGIFGDIPRQALTALLKDISKLSGEEGLIAKWDDAMAAGDLKTARKTLTQIKRIFLHDSWDRTPYANSFRGHIRDLQTDTVGLQTRMRSAGFSQKMIDTARREEQRAMARANTTAAIANSAHTAFLEEHVTSPPAAFHPLIATKLRESALNAAQVKYAADAQTLDQAVKGISEASTFEELRHWLPDEADQLLKEAKGQWQVLAASGVDPIFLHNVSAAQYEYVTRPSVLPNRFYQPGVIKERIFNIGQSVHDVVASVADYKRQLISEAATERFIKEHVANWIKDEQEVRTQLRNALREHPRRDVHGLEALVQRELDAHYQRFDPSRYGFARYFPGAQGKQLLIPNGVDQSLSLLMKGDEIPIQGVYDKTMKLWRMSVLTTPRHLSHIALGGTMMMALREPGAILKYATAHNFLKTADPELLSKLSIGVNDIGTDDLFHFSTGKSLGRMLAETAGGPVRALNRLEDHLVQMQKAATMLSAEGRGLSRDAAIRIANKTLVDMNAMSPFERVVLRKVFPFYGFTRHLFRYLFTYPVDHPIRASILANLANQHREEWSMGGLPQNLSFLFFLGPTDASGNVTGVDYRSIDPFRSYYNDFTLAGISSQLNPVLQTSLSLMGVNVLSATPELYPQTHYDPNSGTIVADKPPNAAMTALEAIIPEVQSIDAFVGITDRFRNLRDTNPRAYRNAITTALGIPFAPSTVNRPQEVAKAAGRRYSDSQKAISAAMVSGNFDDVKRYNLVPTPSLLKRYLGNRPYVPPSQVEAVYRAIMSELAREGIHGVSPHAILPKATR